MKILIQITISGALLLFSSCESTSDVSSVTTNDTPKAAESGDAAEAGKSLLHTTCYACHNPNTASHDALLAPPLAGIKYKYKNRYDGEAQFIAKMSEFIVNPSKEKAIMKGPVKRFGLMPKTMLTEEEAIQVATYIYHNDLEIPSWFSEHFEEHHDVKWEDR